MKGVRHYPGFLGLTILCLVVLYAPLIVVATVQVAISLGLEATLSFLGLGLPITEPSLGLLVANGYAYLLSGYYWMSLFPGLALLVAVLSLNTVADQLGDILNPKFKK